MHKDHRAQDRNPGLPARVGDPISAITLLEQLELARVLNGGFDLAAREAGEEGVAWFYGGGVADDLAGFFVSGQAVAALEDFLGVQGVEAGGEEVDLAGLGLERLGGGAA